MAKQNGRRRIVVKIGSSLLTEASGSLSTERLRRHVEAASSAWKAGHEILIVSSGSIAAGFRKMGFANRPEAVVSKQACAAVGQGLLMQAYAEAFLRHDITAAQVLLTRRDFSVRESYNNALNTLNWLLERRVVPVINENDTVAIEELSFGDNDILAALVAALLHADNCIILTETAGLYDADPARNPGARQIKRVEQVTKDMLASVDASTSRVGTGGMKAKLKAADLAVSMGIEMFIGDGRQPDAEIIANILAGSGNGTYFGVSGNVSLKRKKQWIAFHSEVQGVITIDAGAVKALLEGGKSLLPAGVIGVKGDFGSDAVVKVVSESDALLGKGIVNYPAEQLRTLMGRSTDYARDVMKISRVEVIHRDNWVNLSD